MADLTAQVVSSVLITIIGLNSVAPTGFAKVKDEGQQVSLKSTLATIATIRILSTKLGDTVWERVKSSLCIVDILRLDIYLLRDWVFLPWQKDILLLRSEDSFLTVVSIFV